MMGIRRRIATAAAIGVIGLAGCDSGPGGPGMVSGTVTGNPQLGAVVLEVTWRGIQGFEGLSSTQVYSAPLAGAQNRHRLVLLDPSGGDLHFGINVDDVYLEGPIVSVVTATGADNLPLPVADLRVLLER